MSNQTTDPAPDPTNHVMHTIIATVTFGTRPKDSDICVGKSVCKPLNTVSQESITASFNSPQVGTLTISFNLTDLQQKQPNQVQYFMSGSYMYDVAWPLTDPALAPFNFPPTAIVLTTSPSTVVINNNTVINTINFSY